MLVILIAMNEPLLFGIPQGALPLLADPPFKSFV